jgi:tetratricopeptide (TPR) repeat protein
MHMKPTNPLYMVIMLVLLCAVYAMLWYHAAEMAKPVQEQEQVKVPVADFLKLADDALSQNLNEQAISYYEQGLHRLKGGSKEEEEHSLIVILSLHTNYGSALSSVGRNQEAAEQYQLALRKYAKEISDIVEESFKKEVTDIAAQSSFFLGMVYQDMGQFQDAVDAYSQAHVLDPYHWASVANLAAVNHDNLAQHRQALAAYNKAYQILTKQGVDATDAPVEPRFILSQLQYRIGLCISHDLDAKCALEDDPDKPVSCKEQATHAFAQALEYDSSNEVSSSTG